MPPRLKVIIPLNATRPNKIMFSIFKNNVFELRKKLGITIVIVTHNEELAARADRTLRMADGVFVH